VAHAQTFFGVQLTFVGAAVVLALVHPAQRFAVDLALALGIKNSDYSAHDFTFLPKDETGAFLRHKPS
jgi:hypothetical protein